MSIEELYDEYCKLKEEEMSDEDLEFAFYSKLINLTEEEKDSFSALTISDAITPRPDRRNCTMEEFMRIRAENRKWDIRAENGFVKCNYMFSGPSEKNYIKFYFSVPDELKEKFMLDYGNYVKEHKVRGTFKMRINSQANDLVTVRVYNPKHYRAVFEFLDSYVNKNISQHFLMPTINGIGVTVDDNGSYNRFVTDALMSYFNDINSREDISNSNFFRYIMSPKFVNQLGPENRYSAVIYNTNLLNSLEDDLKIDDIINFIVKSQEAIENYPIADTDITRINADLLSALRSAMSGDMEQAMVRFDFMRTSWYSNGLVTALNYHLQKRKDYDSDNGPLEYLKQQLVNLDANIQTAFSVLDTVYSESGIAGVEEFLGDVENISSNNSDKFNVEAADIYLPFCYNDELHPTIPFSDRLPLKGIYQRVAKKYDVETDSVLLNDDIKSKIVNVYETKASNKTFS